MTILAIFLVNAGLSFALSLVVAHLLGPEGFGRYAVALSAAVVINTVLFEWLRLSTTRFYSERTRREAPQIRATLNRGYLAMAVLVAAVAAFAWASGLRLGELRQVVLLETAAAMFVAAAVSVGLGMASSYAVALFGDMVWTWPDAGVFAMVGIGVLAALVLSTIALPLLDTATRHDAVRFE